MALALAVTVNGFGIQRVRTIIKCIQLLRCVATTRNESDDYALETADTSNARRRDEQIYSWAS